MANIRKEKQVLTKNNSKCAKLAKSANNAKAPSAWQYGESNAGKGNVLRFCGNARPSAFPKPCRWHCGVYHPRYGQKAETACQFQRLVGV